MRKTFFFLISMVSLISLVLAGCGSNTTPQTTQSQETLNPAPAETSKPQVVSPLQPDTIPSSTQPEITEPEPTFPANSPAPPPPPEMAAPSSFQITSAAFYDGELMPEQYTFSNQNQSPPLLWNEPPEGTRSFALTVNDITGNNFVHWVIFNIPGSLRSLSEGVPVMEQLPDGAIQGENHYGQTGYGGPSPTSGELHRYQFNLYALDAILDLTGHVYMVQVHQAMNGHVLAQATLTGTYQK